MPKKPKYSGLAELYLKVLFKCKIWLQQFAAKKDTTMKDVVLAALEEYRERHDEEE